MIAGRSLVQLAEIWQRVLVIFLLQVGEAEIELNLTQLRADSESALVCFDCLSIAMGFGIQDTEVGKRAYITRVEFQNLIETRLRRRIIASVQGLGRRLKGLPRRIRDWGTEQGDRNRGRKKFHEEIFFTSLRQKKRPDPLSMDPALELNSS